MINLIGFSRAEITPELPVNLAGFSGIRTAREVHDPLYVRCLTHQNGSRVFTLLSLDLVAADNFLCRKISSALEQLGIMPENVSIFATHTHSGPGGINDSEEGALHGMDGTFGDENPAAVDRIVRGCFEAVKNSLADMREYKVSTFSFNLAGIGKNRTDPSLAGDEELTAFIFETSEKKLLLYNFSCHPTILSGDSVVVSADLPGEAAKNLYGDFDEVIFINGSCGDISTRFTRINNGLPELERMGKLLSDSILKNLDSAVPCSDSDIRDRRVPITLKVKTPLPVDEAKKMVALYTDELEKAKRAGANTVTLRMKKAYLEGATANLAYSMSYLGATEYTLDCRILHLCGRDICCCPVELFSELSNPVKAARHALFAGYANGYFLYLADKKAHEDGNYEACSSPFSPGEGEHLIGAFEAAL